MQHEFRTPLSTSMQFINVLLDTMLEEQARIMLGLVFSQLSLLLNLVQGLLDIKAVTEGHFAKIIEVFSPTEALHEIV